MPVLFVFLLKVNLALLVFCGGYYLVLRQLTFYTLNRVYLVGALLFTSIYPKINLSAFVGRHPRITEPVQAIVWQLQSPAGVITPVHHAGIWHWLLMIFWLGVVVMAARLSMQFLSLGRVYVHSRPAELLGHKVRIMQNEEGPFSFWTNIYINPKKHEHKELQAILMHEQVHVDDWHTLDILLAELSAVFYWFNPGIWLMKKAVKENIEFITDRKMLRQGVDAKQYQYSLVNVSFGAAPQAIVNHFNISTIKKRIIMMNAKRSSKYNLTRYAILLPVVIVLLLAFTISKAAFSRKTARFEKAHASASFFIPFKPVTSFNTPAIVDLSKRLKSQHDTVQLQKSVLRADTEKKVVNITYLDSAKRTVEVKLIDTNKLGPVVIDDGHLTLRASTYIIDGKVVKENELNNLKNSDIISINVSRPRDGNNTVIYIRTKKGPPLSQINAIRINGSPTKTYTLTFTGKPGFQDSTRFIKRKGAFPDTLVFRDRIVDDSVRYNVSAKPFNTLMIRPGTSLTTFRALGSWNSSVSLNHLSDKLVIIDGKIATKADLKKLSAFDIDRMTLKTDEETESLYGDRAKKGILFIVTKRDR